MNVLLIGFKAHPSPLDTCTIYTDKDFENSLLLHTMQVQKTGDSSPLPGCQDSLLNPVAESAFLLETH